MTDAVLDRDVVVQVLPPDAAAAPVAAGTRVPCAVATLADRAGSSPAS